MGEDIIVALASAVVASTAIVLATLAYREARRVRMLLESVLSSARINELFRIRREYSRKPRRRYIVFYVITDTDISERMLHQSIMRTMRRLLGTATLANSGFQVIYYNPITRKGVIRVISKYKNMVIGSLALVRKIGEANTIIVPLTTTGTVKRAKKIANKP